MLRRYFNNLQDTQAELYYIPKLKVISVGRAIDGGGGGGMGMGK
jgi:hypothetical protein